MKKFLLSIFAVLFAFAGVQAEEASWQMVTNASTLKAGDKIVIVAKDSDKAIGKEQNSNNRKSAAVNKNGNTVSWTAYVQEITLETGTVDGTFAFYVEGSTGKATKGYLYAASSTSNYLKTQTSNNANGCWKITIAADGIATIKAQGANSKNLLKYNKSSDLFSCYSSGQNDVCIYKYTLPGEEGGDEPVVTPPAAPTLPEATGFTTDEFVVEITNNADNAIVYYSLNNENDWVEGSTVTINATTTVYAKAVDADDETNESEVVCATYTKVELTEGCYVKVTSAPADWSGKYLIVYEDGADAYVFSGVDAVNGYVAAEITDGVIVANSEIDAVAVEIATMENGYSIECVNGYIYGTAGQNKLNFDATTAQLNTIELAEDGVEITSGGVFCFNADSNQKRFRYYGKTAQKPVQLYKYTEPVEESWSSFYAAFPVAIPEGIEAYIVTAANGGYVTLTQIYNAVPANTGVILKGGRIEASTDNYYSGAVTEVTGNLLLGTMNNTYIEEEAYVLGKVDGVIGLYKALMTDGQWLNNANKAYLPASVVPASAQGAASFSFRFEGEGTTGVENVEVENEVKVIYDLTGRKVETITAPGIYIVNGVKRVVR